MRQSEKPKRWHVLFKYGKQHDYVTPKDLVDYVFKQFTDLDQFCRVYNTAGTLILADLRKQVGNIENYFAMNPELSDLVIDKVFDEHANQKVMLRIWRDRK